MTVNNRRNLVLVTIVIFFVAVLFAVILGVLFVAKIEVDSRSHHNNKHERWNNKHIHTYVSENRDGESKIFKSMKEINEYSLYEAEYGVTVYPLQYDNEISNGFMKEYVCECNLNDLEDFLVEEGIDDDFFRRSVTMSSDRRSATRVTSIGMAIAGAVGILMMLVKSNIISLRIFAENEMEAEEIAVGQITSRILSEVDPSELEERIRRLEEREKEKDEHIRQLKQKIKEMTACQELFSKERGYQGSSGDGSLEECTAICEVDNHHAKCLRIANWKVGEDKAYPPSAENHIKQGILDFCGSKIVDDRYTCSLLVTNEMNMDRFRDREEYKHPENFNQQELVNFVEEFDSYCQTNTMDDYFQISCYTLD